MGRTRLLLIALLVGLSLLAAACDAGGSTLPNAAARQVLFLASEGATIVSAQLAPEDFGGMDTWCVITESGAGKERWLVFRDVDENERDVYSLTVPGGPPDFEALGCTNWAD